ncbi:MAG: hypothetical protein COB07_13065 [Sulfurovum sp.]|nr:MAG: hypothetical protein COB07_13065 [Sulfurovum sp.]
MSEEIQQTTLTEPYNSRQKLFNKYIVFILINLTVLGFFNQYWDYLYIETFTIALLTAVLLQFLMQGALKIEHLAAHFFESKMGIKSKAFRAFSAWVIIFISKLVILEAINLFFGESVVFSGPIHGLVAFLIVVIVMIIVEQIVAWIYRSLADKN